MSSAADRSIKGAPLSTPRRDVCGPVTTPIGTLTLEALTVGPGVVQFVLWRGGFVLESIENIEPMEIGHVWRVAFGGFRHQLNTAEVGFEDNYRPITSYGHGVGGGAR